MTMMGKPAGLICEAKGHRFPAHATHIYGPECEAESGKLMYLCATHTEQIKLWRLSHMNDPVECPTHGRIGKVRNYLILKAI